MEANVREISNVPEYRHFYNQESSHSTSNDRVQVLPHAFKAKGFTYEQMKRRGTYALLRKRNKRFPEDAWTYEVVELRTHEAGCRFGKEYPASEGMPPSESWGTYGFSYNDLEMAWQKFREMVQEGYGGHPEGVSFVAGDPYAEIDKKTSSVDEGVPT